MDLEKTDAKNLQNLIDQAKFEYHDTSLDEYLRKIKNIKAIQAKAKKSGFNISFSEAIEIAKVDVLDDIRDKMDN